MSSIGENSLRSERMRHKNELKNMVAEHTNEVNKIKNEHEKQKAVLKLQNTVEINNTMTENERKLLQVTDKNENTLRNLQESIELSKERARLEQERIESQLNSKKENQKLAYENHVAKTKENYKYQLEDLEHQAQIEMRRLSNKMRNDKSELVDTSRQELATLRATNTSKEEMTKDLYATKRLQNEEKYHTALNRQKKQHVQTVAKAERSHQKRLLKKQDSIQQEMNRATKDGQSRVQDLQKKHESNYQKNYDRVQRETQNLLTQKEKIIQRFKQKVRQETSLQVNKNDDPFYQFKEIPARVERQMDSYIVKIKVPEHEVPNVRLNADKKMITINMDRKLNEQKNYNDGSQTRLNKVETLTTRLNVDDFLDGKKVVQNYQEGVLSFKIALA
ncbi:MAG: hypothetical protein VYA54_01480 [Bdellovibrionota bacterium]|nr:hypothetical protein [Bdellovibrionota bacterium]